MGLTDTVSRFILTSLLRIWYHKNQTFILRLLLSLLYNFAKQGTLQERWTTSTRTRSLLLLHSKGIDYNVDSRFTRRTV